MDTVYCTLGARNRYSMCIHRAVGQMGPHARECLVAFVFDFLHLSFDRIGRELGFRVDTNLGFQRLSFDGRWQHRFDNKREHVDPRLHHFVGGVETQLVGDGVEQRLHEDGLHVRPYRAFGVPLSQIIESKLRLFVVLGDGQGVVDDTNDDGTLFRDFIETSGVGTQYTLYFVVLVHQLQPLVEIVVKKGDSREFHSRIGHLFSAAY